MSKAQTVQLILGAVIVIGLWFLSQHIYLLPVHLAAFFFSITFVIIADIHGLLWLLGKIPVLPQRRMHWLHRLISFGLLTGIASGALMAWPVLDYLLGNPAFLAKLGLVLALVINSLVIAHHMDTASVQTFRELPRAQRWPLFISGAVSTVGWVGTFIAAQFLGL